MAVTSFDLLVYKGVAALECATASTVAATEFDWCFSNGVDALGYAPTNSFELASVQFFGKSSFSCCNIEKAQLIRLINLT